MATDEKGEETGADDSGCSRTREREIIKQRKRHTPRGTEARKERDRERYAELAEAKRLRNRRRSSARMVIKR